jgi:probable rRNA maturation factor
MLTDCAIEDPRWNALDFETLAEAAASAALTALGHDPARFEIAILACDDTRITTLNTDFRDKPRPTNVLSWPSEERGAAQDGEPPLPPNPNDPELGDIAIAYETCHAEAQAAEIPLTNHVSHLIVHGTLHLLGYDHIRDADAVLMEQLETDILCKMGIPNPY